MGGDAGSFSSSAGPQDLDAIFRTLDIGGGVKIKVRVADLQRA